MRDVVFGRGGWSDGPVHPWFVPLRTGSPGGIGIGGLRTLVKLMCCFKSSLTPNRLHQTLVTKLEVSTFGGLKGASVFLSGSIICTAFV